GDIGSHFADGFRDYIRWVNEHGGIRNGAKIDLLFTDYQYKPDQAIAWLKKLAEQDQVPAISGWGTGDSILMKPQIEDYGIQNVARPSAIVVRDARKLNINAQVLGIHYIGDELLFDLAGEAADGVIASTFVSNWFENVPGMAQVHQINAAYHANVQVRPLHYTQGIVHAMVWVEVLKRAATPDRAGIAKVLGGLRMTTGGLTAPIAYSANNRKGAGAIKLLQADVKTRQFKPLVDWFTAPA